MPYGKDVSGGTVEFLQNVPLGSVLNGSGWAVAFWVTWFIARMVYLGKLVPRSTHDDTVAALEIERERNRLLVEQIGRMGDSMETVEAFVRALPQPPHVSQHRRVGGR